MRTLAIIPARKDSKGLPGKNKRVFMGKPLVSWAIECGMRTCEHVCVTSDDPDILSIAETYDVEAIERPEELAQDDTPMLDVLRHVLAVRQKRNDVIVLLQPTQPLRTDERIRQAVCQLQTRAWLDAVVSVVQIPSHMSPDYAVSVTGRYLQLPSGITRRQDARPAYYRDGTVYAIRDAVLRRGRLYGDKAAPLIVSADESCTIDTQEDWDRAEEMWRKRNERRKTRWPAQTISC